MKERIAGIVAALCIGPAAAAGYLIGDPGPPAPDSAALAATRFIEAYNEGDAKTMCATLDARYWNQYFGFVSPGSCLELFKRGPNDTPLRFRLAGVTHLDGNTALVTFAVIDEDAVAACESGDAATCDAGSGFIQFTMELSRRLPSIEYRDGLFAPKVKPVGERVLPFARWQMAASASVG
jgi:hypothetical protein